MKMSAVLLAVFVSSVSMAQTHMCMKSFTQSGNFVHIESKCKGLMINGQQMPMSGSSNNFYGDYPLAPNAINTIQTFSKSGASGDTWTVSTIQGGGSNGGGSGI